MVSENQVQPDTAKSWAQRNLQGWRSGIFRGFILALVVLIVNLLLTIGVVAKSKTLNNGQKVVYKGDCNRVKQLDVGVHLIINILGTVLLGASNYAMQCLSAPTRQEVDKAHEKRVWLDIGVLSVRNLFRINPTRVRLWALLALTSVPLHLFYNSTIYSSIYASDYLIFMATPDMLTGNSSSQTLGIVVPQNGPDWYNGDVGPVLDYNITLAISSDLYQAAISQQLTRLGVVDCIKSYATSFPTTQGNLILVTENSTNLPYIAGYEAIIPLQDSEAGCPARSFDWICNQLPQPAGGCETYIPCSEQYSQLGSNDWKPFGNIVEYCLAQDIDQKCNLALNPSLIGVVMVFNVVKALLLAWTFYKLKDAPLVTIGDAVGSFLLRKDETTKNQCLMDREDLSNWKNSGTQGYQPPRTMHLTRKRWSSVVGLGRWMFLLALYALMLGICIFLFFDGIEGRMFSTSTLISIPIGSVDPRTFIQGWSVPNFGTSGLVSNVFIANSPQLLLSMIYFTYNGLFTCFLLGLEWNSYAHKRQGLRVSGTPIGEQQSSYFLQLPVVWAGPLMVLSAVLHWLCSQSIFLVSMEFDHSVFAFHDVLTNTIVCDGGADDITLGLEWSCLDQYFSCGYSPVAVLCTIVLGVLMVLSAIIVGLQRYKNGGMPLAGSCSAAISASCHLTKGLDGKTSDEMYLKLQWGEIDGSSLPLIGFQESRVDTVEVSVSTQEVGHCGFSSREVGIPQEGKLYSGK